MEVRMIKYNVFVYLQGSLVTLLEVTAKSSLDACNQAEKLAVKKYGDKFYCYEATPQ
jgi:phage FluMu protein gp41